ncbi:MAG: hypothetical protein ACTHOD_05655 [Motilibacteraceae bacterium]
MRARLMVGMRGRARSDDGVALVMAIAIVGLVSVFVATLLVFTLRESAQTGRDRQRSEAITSAEGAVDVAMAKIQQQDPTSLPCDTSSMTSTQSKPDTMTISTTVTYYDVNGVQLSCSAVKNPSSNVAAATALIKSTSTTTPIAGQAAAVRTIESEVRLTPSFAQGLDKAIFGDAGVTLANKTELYGQGTTPDADIYTNGDFACQNNEHFRGSVYAQGSISLSNSCTIDVDAWAKTGFSSTNPQSTVSGDVKVSSGSAQINAGTIGGKVIAQSVTPSSWCTSHPGKCTTGNGVVSDPPAQPFPILNWDSNTAAQWAANGYTNVITLDSTQCTKYTGQSGSSSSNGPGQWIVDKGNNLSGPTVLVTSCSVLIQNPNKNNACGNKTICLNNNLAVFATGGVTISNTITIQSTNTTTRNLYLVQPYNAVSTHPCTSQGINLDNQVSISSTINELLYSPCTIRKANNTDHYGQIYAGGVAQVDNQLTMYYRPLPVWGLSNTTNKVKYYSMDILYKRETTS